MPEFQLVIAPAAKEDITGIYQYGLRKWGQNQSDAYLENLKQQLWSLTNLPLIGVERPELFPGIRCFPVKSHILFYRVNTKQIEIIRVLHGRQDPHLHL